MFDSISAMWTPSNPGDFPDLKLVESYIISSSVTGSKKIVWLILLIRKISGITFEGFNNGDCGVWLNWTRCNLVLCHAKER